MTYCDACPAVGSADTFGKGPRDEAPAAQRPGLAFQLFPHFLVALGGPDPRVGVLGRLVIGAGDVERHAVVEDHPVAVFRLQRGVGFLVDRPQVLAGGDTLLDGSEQVGDESPGALDAFATCSALFRAAPRPGTSFSAPRAARLSSVLAQCVK